MAESYRKDIDGLRALAVMAVVLFHLGYLRSGYLGVDVFFVISGYLITKRLYQEVRGEGLSVRQFYMRRIRRIIPLILLVNAVVLAVSICVMLPDDLENVAESVVATNFFANNILQYLTVNDYWNPATRFMPLMHTWSLGVEEQFYILYPLLFLVLSKKPRLLLPALVLLTVISVIIFGISGNPASVFYFLPARFFELSLGGIAAILFYNKTVYLPLKPGVVVLLLALLFVKLPIPPGVKLILAVLLSLSLVATQDRTVYGKLILENALLVYIGKISFSIYMWHQVVLAFTRYFIVNTYTYAGAALIVGVILVLSVLTYYFVEQPFRSQSTVKDRAVLFFTGSVFIILNVVSLYIYSRAGVVRDIPELGITTEKAERNMHARYNDRIYSLDSDFTSGDKIKVLVIGHSFARDWANVILASKYKNKVEVSYIYEIGNAKNVAARAAAADYIYFSHLPKSEFLHLADTYKIDSTKVKIIGVKSFGENSGIFYNRSEQAGYCSQRVKIRSAILRQNSLLLEEWGDRYIDIIGAVEKDNTVPVFTPGCKFISQDGQHFTAYGAGYFATLFQNSPALPFE